MRAVMRDCKMMPSLCLNLWSFLALFAGYATAQFPPTPEGVKVLKSKFHEGIEISYKEVYELSSVTFACRLVTTSSSFPGPRSPHCMHLYIDVPKSSL